MDSTAIIDVLSRTLPGDPSRFEAVTARDGMPTIYVAREALVEACRVLRDAPELRFVFLADITAVDYLPRTRASRCSTSSRAPASAASGRRPSGCG